MINRRRGRSWNITYAVAHIILNRASDGKCRSLAGRYLDSKGPKISRQQIFSHLNGQNQLHGPQQLGQTTHLTKHNLLTDSLSWGVSVLSGRLVALHKKKADSCTLHYSLCPPLRGVSAKLLISIAVSTDSFTLGTLYFGIHCIH